MTDAYHEPPTPWTVERWGGRSGVIERVVFSGTQDEAKAEFNRLKSNIHQGTLRLRRPNGVTEWLVTSSGQERRV